MAGKSTNTGLGMYAQQVGYQLVGDCRRSTSVQSGTNALVAFGQQGTQLKRSKNLLPAGIYGAYQLGIGLSVSTAVAAKIWQPFQVLRSFFEGLTRV